LITAREAHAGHRIARNPRRADAAQRLGERLAELSFWGLSFQDSSMKVILFGATGMVGQGVLRESLRDDSVTRVLASGRRAAGQTHAKLRELVRPDMFDFSSAESQLQAYDACFFCLGVSSA